MNVDHKEYLCRFKQIRARSEAKLLPAAFGQEFEDDAKRVPAVFPGIY
jgi:protein-S-isoprenylcysteine O-methyltransferase Ste14